MRQVPFRLSRPAFLHSALAGALLLVLLVDSPALAQNFGSITEPYNAYLANNERHKVDIHNTTSQVGGAIQWAMNNVIDPTDMNSVLVDGNDFDVRVLDYNYGDNNLFGWVNCPPDAQTSGAHPDRWCKGQRLHWNLFPGYEYATDTVQERHSLACHELGHTVGFRHTSNDQSCMQLYGEDPNRPPQWSNHEVNDHISPHY